MRGVEIRTKYNKLKRKDEGYIMIMVVGVLCLFVITAISFTLATNFETRMASSFNYGIKAKYLAEAGIKRAIAELRNQAVTDFIWDENDDWYTGYQDATLLDDRGEYTVSIIDCSAQININDTSANLEEMLAELRSIGLAEGGSILNYRNNLPGGQFETKEQIIQVPGLLDQGEEYDDFKDYITVHSYIDSSLGRSPININTAKEEILTGVLKHVLNNSPDADTLVTAIIDRRRDTVPFSSWSEFDTFIDDQAYLSSNEKSWVKNNANPNRDKSAAVLPRKTTEFCFHAGGYFEIQSTGTRYNSYLQSIALAEKTITTVAQTHNVMYKTTKADFNGDFNYNGTLDAGEIDENSDDEPDFPTWHNANWQDDCPILSTDDNGLTYASGYETILGAIKLGFWDSFDEDNDNEAKEGWSFYNWQKAWSDPEGAPMQVSDGGSYTSAKLWGGSSLGDVLKVKFELKSSTDDTIWTCDDNFSVRVHATDPVPHELESVRIKGQWVNVRSVGDGWDDACNVQCMKGGSAQVELWIGSWAFLYVGSSKIDITTEPPPPNTVASDPDTTAREGKDFFDSQIRLYFHDGSESNHQERLDHLGDIFYGIDCITDHYTNWINDEGDDQYHGVMPEEVTFKFVVSDVFEESPGDPDYRVDLAVGSGWHLYCDYTDGTYNSRQGYSPTTTNYLNIPLHNDTETTFNRYGYWEPRQNGPNQWRDAVNGWFLGLWSSQIQTKWDDVRIIPSSGWYESDWYSVTKGTEKEVRWAAISWTETIPSTADPDSEEIAVSIDTGSGFVVPTFNGSIDALSDKFKFKVDLTSADPDFSETPVFEDITVTYIIPTQIHYWKEFKEE